MSRPFFTPRERQSVISAARTAAAAAVACAAVLLLAAMATHSSEDPNVLNATDRATQNMLGARGAQMSADLLSWIGVGAYLSVAILAAWAVWLLRGRGPALLPLRVLAAPAAIFIFAAFASGHGGQIAPGAGPGGYLGDIGFRLVADFTPFETMRARMIAATLLLCPLSIWLVLVALGGRLRDVGIAARQAALETRRAARLLTTRPSYWRRPSFEEDIHHSEPRWTPPPAPATERKREQARFHRRGRSAGF